MSKPLIAIVGRPNVGKSMLFNKIIGRRLSIVEDTPGVTRDRIYGESDWNGRKFTLVDTGGIEPNTDNEILAFMRQQAQIAIDNATVIVLVTDIKTGMTAADQEVAGMLQRSRKPIVLAVNKMDSTGVTDPEFYEFYNLGLGDPIAVSAVHGHGTGDLLDACLQYFPPETDEKEDSDVVQVAIIGKPNVGKSSLTNALVGEKIAIVSDKPQTTRNRIYGVVNREDTQFVLLDTPGLHKPRSRLGDYMVKVVRESLQQVEAALLLVEPIAHVGEPEKILLQRITEEGLPCVLCINKIDTVEKKDDLLEVIAAYSAVYPGFDAIIPISARTGDGLDDLMAQLQIYATAGPQLFPDGMTTDQPDAQVCAEIVREKMLLCLEKEIPHGTAVEITRFTEREDTGIVDLDVTIYCEKASHKGIIIGKHGAMLKRISSLARRDIEKFMGAKVYMETWVKVKENWRDNVNFIRARGYDEQ